MVRQRVSRTWFAVLILLALLLGLSSVAVVMISPAEPEETQVATEPEAAEAAAESEVLVGPAPSAPPAVPARRAAPADEQPILPTPLVSDDRRRANEVAAVATSRNVSSAQAQFQASAHADEDRDGTGEFGTFGEMSSACPVRGGESPIRPSILSSAFKKVDLRGHVRRSGYVYAIYLTAPGGRGQPERGAGGLDAGVLDADGAETTWCMYAWPEKYGETGRRTFFVNQTGDVTATEDPAYSGENGPAADAAFVPGATTTSTIVGNVAIGTTGNDGNRWTQVN